MLKYEVVTVLMEAAGGFNGYIETLNNGLAINYQLAEHEVIRVSSAEKFPYTQFIEPRQHCVYPPFFSGVNV